MSDDRPSSSASPLRRRRPRSEVFPPITGPSLASFLPAYTIGPLEFPESEAEQVVPDTDVLMTPQDLIPSGVTDLQTLHVEFQGEGASGVVCVVPMALVQNNSAESRAQRELFDKMWGAIGLTPQRDLLLVAMHEWGRAQLHQDVTPQRTESEAHESYWSSRFHDRGLDRVRMVVAFGLVAAQDVLGQKLVDSSDDFHRRRGQIFAWGSIRVLITDEPSTLLQNPTAKKESWEDLKRIAAILGLRIPLPARSGR